MDGTIKVWYYETIELADPPEEERFIEVEPIFEFEIGDYYHRAELMVIVKCDPNPENQDWFGQVCLTEIKFFFANSELNYY